MPHPLKLRLQAKLTLAFVLTLLIPTILTAVYNLNIISTGFTNSAGTRELSSTTTSADGIAKTFEDLKGDVLFVSANPAVKAFSQQLVSDPHAAVPNNLVAVVSEFLISSSIYYKGITILDANGQEVVNFDHPTDAPVLVSESALQDQSKSAFYTKAINLASGAFTSAVDLSATNGKVDVPHVPLLDYSTPLYADNSKVVGVLVLKALADPILGTAPDDPGEYHYIIDNNGNYLSGANDSKLFGNLLANGSSFQKDYPQDFALMTKQTDGVLIGSKDQPDTFQTFARISPASQPDIQWTLVHAQPLNAVLAPVNQSMQAVIVITLVALALTIGIATLLARSIVHPVLQLSQAAANVSRGQWDVPLPAPQGNDEITDLTTAFTNMTRSLRSAYTDLEKRGQELEIANSLAKESSRLKSEFMAIMSHELRTPLNAMLGFSGIMLEGMGGEMDEDATHMVERMDANARRLLSLINDVLDIAKIEAGRLEIVNTPVAPSELATTWRSQMGILAESKQLAFEIGIDPLLPPMIYADKERLSQVVINLLGNAFKFTEAGGVRVFLKCADENWQIQVVDTGIGIPPHALNYIFDEFRQLDGSTKRAYGGTGLGLAIVRNLCRMMDGNIQVSSVLDQGSTFTVTLPLKPALELVLA